MKKIFIEAKVKINLDEVLKKINIPEKRIGIITTVQFEEEVKKLKNPKFIYGGSILGCNQDNALNIVEKVEAFLFIGSGDFHPLGLKKFKKPIYEANPLTNKFRKIPEKELEALEKKQKGKLLKYYNAKKLGIIVCTKPGQNLFQQAVKLQEKLKKPSFIFICNDVDPTEFENFTDIDIWINTACPRIEHKKIINMKDLPDSELSSRRAGSAR